MQPEARTLQTIHTKNDISLIVRCPITGLNMELLDIAKLEDLVKDIPVENISNAFLQRFMVDKSGKTAFISQGGEFLYPVEDDILFLHRDFAIPIQALKAGLGDNSSTSTLKASVQKFYDEIGWKKDNANNFIDAAKFEDLRSVSQDYIQKCHFRINRFLKSSGKYIVDVASGPIQYDEYLSYSQNYEYRICIDLSIKALEEAKKKLGDKGIYVLADITNLPFKNDSIDSVISLHTIYHVPETEQSKAFEEIHRVLQLNSNAVIIYAWDKDALLRKIKNLIKPPKLYYKAQNYQWYCQHVASRFNAKIYSWRSISVPGLRLFIHSFLLGKPILKLLYWLEEKFPSFMGRYGHYPLIVLKK